LDEASVFIAPRGCERQFGTVERALSVEHFEIGRRYAFITKSGYADGFLQINNAILLAQSHLMKFFITYECIGDVSKRLLDGLLVRNESLLVFDSARRRLPFSAPPVKMGWLTCAP